MFFFLLDAFWDLCHGEKETVEERLGGLSDKINIK